MGLNTEVARAVAEMGFLEPMAVQKAVYRRAMQGRDLLVQSRTGSGKTAAFAIPFAQGLIDPELKHVQALILAPTRELALQVAAECERIGKYRGLAVVPVYGGAPMGRQVQQLAEGAHIVSGTPGRVLDHLRRGTLKLDSVRVLVLDEADEMLSMGFLEDITEIIRRTPKERQTLLFSATIPPDIERIAQRYMKEPDKVQLSADFVGVQDISHYYYMIPGMARHRDLLRILEVERPDSAVIFCNTRDETSFVAEFLRKQGLDAENISSDLAQKDRERVMGRMKAGNLHYLVATDIAARGIDISDLSHVINYTFPESAEVYVHRTGRTGRAGKKGTAISLISPRELGNFYMLKLTYKIRPEERPLPTDAEVETRREASLVDELRASIGQRPASDKYRQVARRLWTAEDGERLVAILIEECLSRPAAKAAPSTSSPSTPATSPATGSAERPAPRAAERPAPRAAERPATAVPPPSVGGAPAQAPEAAGAEQPDQPDSDPTRRTSRRRSRDGRREREAPRGEGKPRERSGRKAAIAAPPKGPTIDDSGGREFWEAWVDAQPAPAGKPAPTPRLPDVPTAVSARRPDEGDEPSGFPDVQTDVDGQAAEAPARPRRERDRGRASLAPVDAGMARLYLNLGRRDGMSDEQIAEFLRGFDVSPSEMTVQGSHTYLVVTETEAEGICARLTGAMAGDRAVTCEPARRR